MDMLRHLSDPAQVSDTLDEPKRTWVALGLRLAQFARTAQNAAAIPF
jgi:hypothetical protein